ncbi:PPE family protein [Umezawaea endophytica]|uniref:PPE family protein n=1 Tax=Umezawaea endophytica TaxID=1654476 RepID=A0A9X2VX75_9PSEU|nr:PPE family protein [Umezawaea endophytica]MCS7484324.1 PPE family protein [Umezawaea endophytica]
MPDGHRWNGYSHEELYKQINSGPGPKASHASMERWQGVSAALVEINNELYSGVLNSGARWEGKAADTARAGLNPLAAWADDARTGADVMRVSAEMQADFISKARSDMPAPVPVTAEDPGKILSALTHLVGGQTDYEVQEKAHSAAEQRAREVMATYASSTTTNTSTLGQFHQPPQLVINPSQHSLGNVHGISGGLGGEYGVVSGRGGAGGRPASRPGGTNRQATAPRGVAGNTTGTSGATGSPTTSTTGTTRTANGVGAPGTTGGFTGGVIGGPNSKPRKDDTKSSSADDGHPDRAGGQAGGAGRQSGVTTVSGAEFGPVATPTAQPGSPTGHGPAGGPAAGTATDNDTVHRRATPLVPAQASFDPFGNAGGAGAARANEEEDGEHDAADYLRETDDIYGIGGMISPPVIGENQSS